MLLGFALFDRLWRRSTACGGASAFTQGLDCGFLWPSPGLIVEVVTAANCVVVLLYELGHVSRLVNFAWFQKVHVEDIL